MSKNINVLAGRYLKRKRIEQGLTGAELGRLLYISQQQISRYERGVNTITLNFILLLVEKLNLKIDDFYIYIINELNIESRICDEINRRKESLYNLDGFHK